MAQLLDDKVVGGLPAPATGNKITYDSEVKGFGVRVTAAGAKSFILNYRSGGRERRITIGSHPEWKVAGTKAKPGARDHAKALKRRIDLGEDPMGERHEDRAAATMDTLADRFVKEHLSKRRETTQADYKGILRLYIHPHLGKIKVADLRHDDIERLHATVAKTAPYRANRCAAVLSKMLNLAVKWEMRTDNPARGIERAPEVKRERYLSAGRNCPTERGAGRPQGAILRQCNPIAPTDRCPQERGTEGPLGGVRSWRRRLDQTKRPHQNQKRPPSPAVRPCPAAAE